MIKGSLESFISMMSLMSPFVRHASVRLQIDCWLLPLYKSFVSQCMSIVDNAPGDVLPSCSDKR